MAEFRPIPTVRVQIRRDQGQQARHSLRRQVRPEEIQVTIFCLSIVPFCLVCPCQARVEESIQGGVRNKTFVNSDKNFWKKRNKIIDQNNRIRNPVSRAIRSA